MRPIIAALIVAAIGSTQLAAQETQEDRITHALHGLMTMYSAGSVCSFNKWSFTAADTDEMLAKIKELSRSVPQSTVDGLWAQGREIMAEGQASANVERCAQARERYAVGRPFLLKIGPEGSGKAKS